MLGFLYKDIITNKKWLALTAIVLVLFNGMSFMLFIGDDTEKMAESMGLLFKLMFFSFSALSFFISGNMASNYFQTDERKNWGYYVVSTSNGAAKQVTSKYLFILLMSGFTYLICIITNLMLRNLFPDFDLPDASGAILIFLFIQMFLRAVETPFIVGFGSNIGSRVKGAIMLGFILLAAIYFMFADLSWMGSSDHVIEKIFDLIAKIKFTDILDNWGGRLLLMSFPLYVISCFISTKLYIHGIERLEK